MTDHFVGPPIELTLVAQPEHVRTARLVAVAVARTLSFADALLDEVRLAVGEVCARAVRQAAACDPPRLVRVDIDDRDGLQVRVHGSGAAAVPGPGGDADELSLAVVRGLVPSLRREPDAVVLHWPAAAGASR